MFSRLKTGIILFFLGLPFVSFCLELPKPGPAEYQVLLLNEETTASLVPRENYDNGVCYGIDQVNFLALTRLRFESGPRDKGEDIVRKIEDAFKNGSPQTIYGWNSAAEFMAAMDDTWEAEENPLKRAIESIQLQQNQFGVLPYELGWIKNHLLKRRKALYEMADDYTLLVDRGIISQLALQTGKSAHVVSVVGYQKNLFDSSIPPTLLVLDPNHKDAIKKLKIRETTVKGKTYSQWYYEPWNYQGEIIEGDLFNGIVAAYPVPPDKKRIEDSTKSVSPQFQYGANILTPLTQTAQVKTTCQKPSRKPEALLRRTLKKLLGH